MERKRILITTDTFEPSVNGVSRSLREIRDTLCSLGHVVELITPSLTVPNFFYPDLPIALPRPIAINRQIDRFRPDSIHIATEGPLGMQVRNYCLRKKLRFTTSFHTLWPAYFHRFLRLPHKITWQGLRWFHDPAEQIMTRSRSMAERLTRRGFRKVVEWNGGVDLGLFYPRPRKFPQAMRPIWLYVGRVSIEKNLEAFLEVDFGFGTKMVVGDGPHRARLQRKYPEALFTGKKTGEELAQLFAEGDVFVFPSKTDTFGRVIVEALASGVPVAAFPTTGPKDIITSQSLGCIDTDLRKAALTALEQGDKQTCIQHAKQYSVPSVSQQFLSNLVPAT